jgi:hypothetical protein
MDEVLRTALEGPLPVLPPTPESDIQGPELSTRH